MNQTNLQILTARVRGLGRELLAIANQLDAQAPHLAVQLPPRDLFSDIFGETKKATDVTMTDAEMVAALRGNGWTVTCTRTITEEL